MVILYHANCPDGFGAAFAAWKVFGSAAQYVPFQHGDAPIDVTGKHVWMLDCCYRRDEALAVAAQAVSFVVLDHHLSMMEECGSLPFCYFDMTRSGMGLAWDYFHPQTPRPALVTHVEDRDLRRWEHPDSRAFCLNLETMPRDFGTWNALVNMTEPEHRAFVDAGRMMIKQTESVITKFCRDAKKATFMGHRVWVVNVPRPFATDDCGEQLAARDDTDFAIMWSSTDLTEVKLSFRSAHGFNVAKVARLLGGGGHAIAAGATLNFDTFKSALTFQ